MRLQLRGSFCHLWRPGSQPAFRRRTPPLPVAAFEAGRNRSQGEVKQKEGIVTEPWPPAIQKQVDPPEARVLPSLFTDIRFTEEPGNTIRTTAAMNPFIRQPPIAAVPPPQRLRNPKPREPPYQSAPPRARWEIGRASYRERV